ncbi:MAG: glycosyltransferase [Microthrixaceae bacterium]
MQLIVLGMHRSGTSSVTRLLNLAGAYFGPEGSSTEANDENPKGFWERRDIRNVCDGLLHGGGFDWWKVADFDPDRLPEAVVEEQLSAFRRIVLQLDAHRPWVIKEPRLCLLLPVLRSTLEVPVCIHVTREPLEIAESLAARNGFPIPVGLALWEVYTRHALAAAAGLPSVAVSYADVVRDPVTTTRGLLEQLRALGVQGLRDPTDAEINAFITPTLHRQHRAEADRRGYLNAEQTALARAADKAGFPARGRRSPVSAGALESLRAFEAHEALAAKLAAELSDERAEAVAALERATAAHREIENGLRSTHRELEANLRDAHEQMESTLKATMAAQAEAVALAVEQATRSAERQAIDALNEAGQKVRLVRASGAVRYGSRLAKLRGKLRRGSGPGVDAAINSALQRLDAARAVLEAHLDGDHSPVVGPDAGAPPSPEELRLRRLAARTQGERTKVAVLAWDLGHNPFGRAHLLADLLKADFDVEVWGSQFDRYGTGIWAPLRDTKIPVRRLPGRSFPEFLDTLEDAARRIDADAIYVSKPRLPSLALGVLAKEQWNRSLIVDIDDFEPAFFDETQGLAVDDLRERRDDPDLLLPFGRLWTRACEAAVRAADQLTVSNPELEARYGGVVIPHARDEEVFDPGRHDRVAARRRLGLGESDRLVLFGGTPRAHKGVVELLEAIDTIGDDNLRVGVFASRELDELRRQIGRLERWILPLPPRAFDELPALLAATDLACALQAPDHPVSQHQMPAKVTDAMAMGVPCLVTAVPPLQPLIDKDVVEVVGEGMPLHERIRDVFLNAEETADRARRARELFLESYSYAAVRPLASAAIERFLDNPPAPAEPLTQLVAAAGALTRPSSGAQDAPVRVAPSTPAERPHIPPGTTYDLIMFWKQNDTGIYGRRQDMFLKYLEQSGRFHRIVHFDQPMSVEGLALLARRSIGTTDQNRLVLAQTLRRIARRSDKGRVRQRTFLYSDRRRARPFRVPRRSDYLRFVRSVLEHEGVGSHPLLMWVYPTNSFIPELVDALHPDVVVADVVDDNRTWYQPGTKQFDQLERNYAEILTRSDIVLANCEPVAASMRSFSDSVEVVPNACELPEGVRRGERPSELRGLRGPVVGYAGNLSDRIDLDLLRGLVEARRDWSFVFLGSTHLDRSALELAEEPNVRFVGTRRHDDAQAIIRHFDVALIPHLDNDMTRSMNPLKAYVYCSLGVPIVSTPVANLDELAEFITIASGRDEFVTAIERAISTGRRQPDRAALLPHSWEQRVERVLAHLDDVTSARPLDHE